MFSCQAVLSQALDWLFHCVYDEFIAVNESDSLLAFIEFLNANKPLLLVYRQYNCDGRMCGSTSYDMYPPIYGLHFISYTITYIVVI